MAEEGTTGDPQPPFDDSFVMGGPHEPSHRERQLDAERRAAAERQARLRAQREAASPSNVVPFRRRRSRKRPEPSRERAWGGGGAPGTRDWGNKWVAIALIAVAVAGLALRGVSFSSGHSSPPVSPVVTAPATSVPTGSGAGRTP